MIVPTKIHSNVLACIVAYNSGPLILDAVRSLQTQTHNVDILIVDNNSEISYFNFLITAIPAVHIIKLNSNIGYTGGNNTALDYAYDNNYDYMFVVNPDVILGANTIENMLLTAKLYPSIGILGCKEVSYNTGVTRSVGGGPYNFWLSRRYWYGEKDIISKTSPFFSEYAQGAFFLISRNVISNKIKFSPELFAYVDEIDYGIKVRKAGYSIIIDPNITFLHRVHNPPFRPVEGYLMHRNRTYIVLHHASLMQKVLFIMYMTIIEMPLKLMFRSLQGKIKYCLACVFGYIDGISGNMGRGRIDKFIKS